jgi:hypothetical protein
MHFAMHATHRVHVMRFVIHVCHGPPWTSFRRKSPKQGMHLDAIYRAHSCIIGIVKVRERKCKTLARACMILWRKLVLGKSGVRHLVKATWTGRRIPAGGAR